MAHFQPNQIVAKLKADVRAAVQEGNIDAVRTLLQNCEDHVRDQILTGEVYPLSLLKRAVAYHRTEIVKLLVQEFHVDLSVIPFYLSECLEEALIDAVRLNDEEMVRTLVELGANVNYDAYSGLTPLKIAWLGNNISMAKLLKDLGAADPDYFLH